MHSTMFEEEYDERLPHPTPKRTCFIHNGDYHGDVTIRGTDPDDGFGGVVIPFDHIEKFYAAYIQDLEISKIERMTAKEIISNYAKGVK